MTADADDLKALLDRDRIRQCLERLARGEDRRDGDLVTGALWPDAIADYGIFKGDYAAYVAGVVPGAEEVRNTQHLLGQSYIELDGTRARVETHVLAYHRVHTGTDDQDSCIGGRYLDVMEKRGGEWRIAERIMLYDWYHDWGPSIDWSQGLMGAPLSHDWFAGRAHGDYSAKFFAGRAGA